MSIELQIITALLGSGFVGGIGYWIKHVLDSRFGWESGALLRRREVYDDVARDLRLFIEGDPPSTELQQSFFNTYSTLWFLGAFLSLSAGLKDAEYRQHGPTERACGRLTTPSSRSAESRRCAQPALDYARGLAA